jgi:hypothetical protein
VHAPRPGPHAGRPALPYAEDFDAAAIALEAAAQVTATLLDPARAALGDGVMVGGALTAVVSDELDSAGALLQGVTTELGTLAATCRERAEICRQALVAGQHYAADFADYEAALRDLPPGDRAPEPPAAPEMASAWVNR